MSERWLIVADDLTGAADCAVAFATRNIDAAVVWAEDFTASRSVLAYNADTRALSAAHAAERHRALLGETRIEGRTLFKKIDSTLRGQPAAEIAAVLEAARAAGRSAVFGILAPAFPARGRTTQEGRVYVEGAPLEDTEIWRKERSYSNADLVEILATAGVRGGRIGLEQIRGARDALYMTFERFACGACDVVVCDAVTQEDLERIAAAARTLTASVVFIGTAGLARALAAGQGSNTGERPSIPISNCGALIAVGSQHSASKAAAHQLALEENVRSFRFSSSEILAAQATRVDTEEMVRALAAGCDVLAELELDAPLDPTLLPLLADRLGSALAPVSMNMSALVATGGETASALLRHMGATGILMLDELEAGVCLGLTCGSIQVPVVTKAGAFGDQDTLLHIVRRLRLLRETGSFE